MTPIQSVAIFLLGPLAFPFFIHGHKRTRLTVADAQVMVYNIRDELNMSGLPFRVTVIPKSEERYFEQYLAFADIEGVYTIHVMQKVLDENGGWGWTDVSKRHTRWQTLNEILQHEVLHVRFDAGVLQTWGSLPQNEIDARHQRIFDCVNHLQRCRRP